VSTEIDLKWKAIVLRRHPEPFFILSEAKDPCFSSLRCLCLRLYPSQLKVEASPKKKVAASFMVQLHLKDFFPSQNNKTRVIPASAPR
jgi:hypothetical protein